MMLRQINIDYTVERLLDLLNTPSPSGNTEKVMKKVASWLERLDVPYTYTNKGQILATITGSNDQEHRLLTAHVDTLGAMVRSITTDGYLKLVNIGGFRWNSVEGEYCEIETASGKLYTGTIQTTKPTVHVYSDMGSIERSAENMVVRLDERVKSAADVRALGIEVGDFVSFDPRAIVTESGFIKSRHIDDKASVAILFGVMKAIKEEGVTLPYTTHFLISNNEEIGYGGNSNIPAQVVEYLAVDMGAIGADLTTDEYCVSICALDSSGPYNKAFRQKLVELAKENEIYYHIDIYPHYGSDASAAIRAGFDIKHALIGPGVHASHSQERTHKEALDNTAKLILCYIQSK